MPATELYTATQVGQLLDVDTSTVYRMAGDGRLPAVRVGRQWRFPAGRIARALEVGVPTAPPAFEASAPARPASLPAHLVGTVVDLVAHALGVMMVVTDMQGRPLAPPANPCPWFLAHAGSTPALAQCLDEWREMAAELDLVPQFRQGRHGFLCARTFVRSGTELVGMVLAGGVAVAPEGRPDDGLHHLDEARRDDVLRVLPRVAAALSPLAVPVTQPADPPPARLVVGDIARATEGAPS